MIFNIFGRYHGGGRVMLFHKIDSIIVLFRKKKKKFDIS